LAHAGGAPNPQTAGPIDAPCPLAASHGASIIRPLQVKLLAISTNDEMRRNRRGISASASVLIMQSISAQVCGSEREGLLQGSLLLQMHCGAAAAVKPRVMSVCAAGG
jgi:hypothetical protein